MKRAKQLGSVVFGLNTLFVQEEMSDDSIMGETAMSAAGTHIVFEAAIATPYITLDSQRYGWILDAQRVALMAMWQDIGATLTLTYDDNSTETVRMAREKKNLFKFTPLYEGSKKYTVIVPLAKVL